MMRKLLPLFFLLILTGINHKLRAEPIVVEIGDHAATTRSSDLPLSFLFLNSLSESLYFADELGVSSGMVTSVGYKIRFTGASMSKPVKLYMANVSNVDLSSGWLPSEGFVPVFDGLVDFPTGTAEVIITLSTPFHYSGANLVIRVNRPLDSLFYDGTKDFYYSASSSHSNRSRYARSHAVVYNPMSPSGSSTLNDRVPHTRLWFVVDAEAVTGLSIFRDQGAVTLSWDEYSSAIGYNIYGAEDPLGENWELVGQSLLNNITLPQALGQSRFYRVKAVLE